MQPFPWRAAEMEPAVLFHERGVPCERLDDGNRSFQISEHDHEEYKDDDDREPVRGTVRLTQEIPLGINIICAAVLTAVTPGMTPPGLMTLVLFLVFLGVILPLSIVSLR